MAIADRPNLVCFISLMSILPCLLYAQADTPREASTFTFYQENDLYTGTDRDYTSGTKLTWISADLTEYRKNPNIPRWSYPLIDVLPFVNEPGLQRTLSLSIGQNIYTPEDIMEYILVDGDRPYAGISYLSVGFHSRNSRRMDTLEFDVGIVGPHSYAEKSHKLIHRWTNSKYPNGWENQIKDEPFLNIYYERKWKILQSNNHGFGADLIPHTGCSVGNALTAVNAGGQLRLGWNLPNDFGTFIIRPGSDTNAPFDAQDPRFYPDHKRFGMHAFAAFDGYAVLRNIVLDGNLFRESYRVDKKPFVANLVCGIGLIVNRFKITYAYVYKTKEFATQDYKQVYGAITFSYTF
ncbi:MAG: lipid A deacylase LpxR family protein [Deltaproteobacteria bacterium]|nr:lipid A deacylase LpxR family protein [Deltaproteobacteria bacterium]